MSTKIALGFVSVSLVLAAVGFTQPRLTTLPALRTHRLLGVQWHPSNYMRVRRSLL